MRLWDNLRTAFQLAARVEECESRVQSLEYEWGDINEKLLAREARLNKRMSRELKSQLSEPEKHFDGFAPYKEGSPPTLALSGERSQEKKAIAKQFSQQRAER